MLIPRKKIADKTRTKASIAVFIITQLILATFASSTALASSIKYDDSYTYDGGSSSDAVAWGGSSLSTKLDGYPSGTQVACFDWCNDGTIDRCYGESGNMDKCKKSSSTLKNLCNAGKCDTWSWWEFWRSVGEWHGIDTKSAGDRWKCSIWSRYYWNCGSTNYNNENTPYAYTHYVTYPRQYDCDGDKTKTYDDRAYFSSTTGANLHLDISCSGNRVCNQAIDDEKADYGWYGTSKPNEPCSVPDGSQDCDSNSDCFSGSICDCDDWLDCNYDLLSGDKDYCCPSGQKWDGSKCATPCKDNDGDGHKDGSCGGDDCNDGDSGVWKKNSCDVCAKEPSGLGDSCSVGVGACQRTGKNKCDSAGTGTTCDVSPGNPSTESCDGVDNDCDGETDEGVKNACGTCGPVPTEVCNDGADNDCDGKTDSADTDCCPSDKPYYWGGECKECPEGHPNKCGGECVKCENSDDSFTCYQGEAKCCPSSNPYYCAKMGNGCTKDSGVCDKVQKCGNEGWTYCPSTDFPNWNCRDDGVSRCCPTNYPYLWNSDWLCHTTTEPQKCSVPDGSSANCDCDTDADCQKADSSKPYCGQTYGKRTSNGYHACLSTKPQYCGDGTCNNEETYSTCNADCTAPKGKITATVYQSTTGKAISGAYVYLDSVPKGTTNSEGKASFEANYGNRNVKAECPEGKSCGEKTINVDGEEYASFGCECNPEGDSDGDGNSDEDEKLLGTDINNPNDNFRTAFSPFEHPQSCMDVFGILNVIWKNRDDLIQANEMVINALNTTAVMTADLQENPDVVAQTLSKIRINGELEKSDLTLMQAIESSDDVDGFFTENGALLVITDYETSSTAIIAISATCVGTFVGTLYGAGTGIKDDVVAIGDIIKGIWYLATASDEKIASDIDQFIKAIPQLFGKAGELFHDMIIGILEKGQWITQKTGLFKSDKTAYLQFQIGFTNGFITGYVAEQVAAMFVGAGTILKALKAGKKTTELVGKTAKLSVILAKITDNFGGEVASAIKKLKYAEKIAHWTEEEQNALAELIKLGKNKNVRNFEKWLDDAGEAGAKHATNRISSIRKAGKLTDDQLAELMNTNLGRQTLTAADTTDDLLVKQSKLVQKWGASKVDDVVNKCFLGLCYGNRIDDLNKILKAMPENLADDLGPESAVKFLGNKDVIKGAEELAKFIDKATLARYANDADSFEAISKAAGKAKDKFGSLDNLYPALKSCFGVSGLSMASVCSPADIEKAMAELKGLGKFSDNIIGWTLDGIKAGVIDVNKVVPEKLAQYIKGFGKNPFDSALGDKRLVKMLKREGGATKAGNEIIDDVVVLSEGKITNEATKAGFGRIHIMEKHLDDFKAALDIKNQDEVLEVLQEVLEKGNKVPGNPEAPHNYVVLASISRNGKTNPVRVIINQESDLGSVTSAYPLR